MAEAILTGDTEVRHLPDKVIAKLTTLLSNENNHNFKIFMRLIPDNLDDCHTHDDIYSKKYSEDDVNTIIRTLNNHQENFPTLFFEWGTSGRNRPRIGHLIALLDKIGHTRASNYLRAVTGIQFHSNEEITMTATDTSTLAQNFTAQTHSIIETFIEPDVLNALNIINFDYQQVIEQTERFQHSLGKGGFGEVFRATNLRDNIKFAAVKKLTKIDNRLLGKFVNELKLISGFSHPNVIRLLGFSVTQHPEPICLCLVFEYAKDGSLRRRLNAARDGTKQYVLPDRIKHLHEVSKALHYLHVEKKLIHRDIKPDNVLIHDNEAKVCDFGLLRHMDSSTETKIIGTQGYLAPEMYHGYDQITEKGDIYAFGHVILESITGLDVHDSTREPQRIAQFVVEHKDAIPGAQKYEGDYDDVIQEVIDTAIECTDLDKDKRPHIMDVREKLADVYDRVDIPQISF